MSFKIEFDKKGCIGCGACASVCENNWEIIEEDNSYKAHPKETDLEELGCNKEAEEVCPVKVIKISEMNS